MYENTFEELVELVEQWAIDRNLHTADPKVQYLKIIEELGETAGALARNNNGSHMDAIIDGIGDTVVTIVIYLQQQDLSLVELLTSRQLVNRPLDDTFILDQYNYPEDATPLSVFNAVIESVGAKRFDETVLYLGLLSGLLGINLNYCLQSAYNEIKDRKGKMVNGTFIKEGDSK